MTTYRSASGHLKQRVRNCGTSYDHIYFNNEQKNAKGCGKDYVSRKVTEGVRRGRPRKAAVVSNLQYISSKTSQIRTG